MELPIGKRCQRDGFQGFAVGDFQGGGRRRGPDAPSLDRRVTGSDFLEKILVRMHDDS